MALSTNRFRTLTLLILATILLGILSRLVTTGVVLWDKYLGDALYAILVYLLLSLGRWRSLWGKALVALQYGLLQSGPMSMAPSQFGMFTKSDPAMATPDLEYHVQPLSTDRLGDPLHPFPAITVSVCNLRPESVGASHITDRDVARQPDIRLNYLSVERDRQVALLAVRQARQIMTARALARYRPEEILPGPAVASDEELLAGIGDIATTIFHPVGTCRMGTDPQSVVDAELRVRGLGGLRVVDASIMPKIVSGNTASPVVMIAEKAADMISRAGGKGL